MRGGVSRTQPARKGAEAQAGAHLGCRFEEPMGAETFRVK